MSKPTDIKLFENKKVRSVWDAEAEKWYISIVDVIEVLTESPNPRKYWSVLKTRLKQEGSELATNCSQLKMQSADGKFYKTDVADVEQLFRLIQSIPSPKAEPFKLWLSELARERLEEEYKQHKGLKTESLRDNMTNLELVLNMLAEATTTEISKEKQPVTFSESREIARQGGEVAGNTRKEIEAKTGKKIVSPLNAKTLKGNQVKDIQKGCANVS